MQKGEGFNRNNAKINAVAVNAFSPPDNRWIWLFRLPGGCAITEIPVVSKSSDVNSMRAAPPPNNRGKRSEKFSFTLSKVSLNDVFVSLSILIIASCNKFKESFKSVSCLNLLQEAIIKIDKETKTS